MADLVQAHAERLENPGGDALTLTDQAEQQVLRADVVVAETAGLVYGQLDDALGARRKPDLADDRTVPPPDDELDRRPDLGQLDVHVLQHARSHAFALPDEAEEQVLRADVVVVEPLGFVLRKSQDFAGAIRELVEPIHGTESLFSLAEIGDLRGMLARVGCRVTRPYRGSLVGPTRGPRIGPQSIWYSDCPNGAALESCVGQTGRVVGPGP